MKLCEQTQNVAEGSEAVGPWGLGNKKEIIQDVDHIRDT